MFSFLAEHGVALLLATAHEYGVVPRTNVHQHYMDEWNGILNLPANFACHSADGTEIERTTRL